MNRFEQDGKPTKRRRPADPDAFHWYKRFPAKALKGFRELNPEQRGVYATIIELCYDQRAPLADDDMRLARDCNCDVRKYRRIKAELLDLGRIKAEGGLLWDERSVAELVSIGMVSETNRARALKRGKSGEVVRLAVDNAKALRPYDRPELGVIVEPNVSRTPNEINDPKHANRVREDYKSGAEGKAGASAPRPPLDRGGARHRSAQCKPPTHGMSIDEWRKQQAAALGLAEAGKDETATDANIAPIDDEPLDVLARALGADHKATRT